MAELRLGHEWLTRKEASTFLETLGCPISPDALANMAANGNQGRGPPYTRIRWKIVRYKRADLAEWARKSSVRIE